MKVFSKEKFFQDANNCAIYCRNEDCRAYVDEADGKPIANGFYKGKFVKDEWLVEVYNPVEETGKILNTYFPNGFPEPEPQHVNCRCTVLTEAPPKHPRYKIVIECNDDFTTAKMYVDGQQVKGECAKRHPADKYNWRIGAQTAFNRLWEKKKKPEPAKNERAAKPGEYVRIVETCLPGTPFGVGSIVKIVDAPLGCEVTNHAYYRQDAGEYLYPFEYEVIDNYKPE